MTKKFADRLGFKLLTTVLAGQRVDASVQHVVTQALSDAAENESIVLLLGERHDGGGRDRRAAVVKRLSSRRPWG